MSRAVGRIAKMRTNREKEREENAKRYVRARTGRMKKEESNTREREKTKERTRERQESGQAERCRDAAPAGDLYRIISPSECLHF